MNSRSIYNGIAVLIVAVAATGCTVPDAKTAAVNPDPAHNARNSLDWAGSYYGVLPCADCEGIETVVTLDYDGTYDTRWRYLGKGDEVFSEAGSLSWNEAGSTVTLSEDSGQYFVGEHRLFRLARDGSRIRGDLAEHYVLTRPVSRVTERYWKLVELNGQPVAELGREPYFILQTEDERVYGVGGCNSFGGTYELDEANSRIRFGHVASTKMACASGMDVETGFHGVLSGADTYSLEGDHLTLSQGQAAPLARFEAVYLY